MKCFLFNKLSGMIVILVIVFGCTNPEKVNHFEGPLRKSTINPRYFTDNSGMAVYLTGFHTWNNLVDMFSPGSTQRFDFPGCLHLMKHYNCNFMRMWAWELLNWDTEGNREANPRQLNVAPHPWLRTGPGNALDGKLKFDLKQFDPEYFSRLEERVKMAYDSGIYVSIMLFEGWGLQFSPGAFENHPFHPENNINGIDGDLNGDSLAVEIHTLGNKEILAIQESYVKHAIETVNRFENVLYEISNENHPPSTEWQYYFINLIKEYEKTMPSQHPVGMTFQYRGGSNKMLFESPADWISPNPEGGYRDNPPPADGSKVILTDTDHLWGIGGNTEWIWKSFLRGLNPLFMDPYDCDVLARSCDTAWMNSIRRGLGYTRTIAGRLNLNSMLPAPEIASSSYCLACPGKEYVVYLADTNHVDIDLADASGTFQAEWFNTNTGFFSQAEGIRGGDRITLKSPFGNEAVLLLKRSN